MLALETVTGGGNNRIYRVHTEAADYALKHYSAEDGDTRDRLGQEWEALSLLAEALPGVAPRPVAFDRSAGWALHEWIDGEKVGRPGAGDIAAAVRLVQELRRISRTPEARRLRAASEACLSLAELDRQVEARLQHLASVDSPELASFLGNRLRPLFADARGQARRLYSLAGLDPAMELAGERRVLSPSDFGFHNALRRADGGLVFIDFEYFGWDEPAKLAADFLYHPGMALAAPQRQRFRAAMAACFADDPHYLTRVAAFEPIIGLRWCLIVLNEYLPERWRRRLHAGLGQDQDWLAIKRRQLGKARSLYRLSMGRYLAARGQ